MTRQPGPAPLDQGPDTGPVPGVPPPNGAGRGTGSRNATGTALLVLAVLWAAAIYWTSSRPNPFPSLPTGLLAQDKLLHALAYAVLAGLVLGAISAARRPGVRAVALAAALAAGYGATDEWHQSKVPNRDADLADLAADAAGAVAGACLAALILRRRGARASIRA